MNMNNIPFFNDYANEGDESYLKGTKRLHKSIKQVVTGITCDSRNVKPGNLFVAIRGEKNDGTNFIEDAIKKGAKYICINKKDFFKIRSLISLKNDVFLFAVDDTSQYLGEISSIYYDNPSENLTLVGITGTNGKTTTTYILESIFKQAGLNPGVVGTVNVRYNHKIQSSTLTTPNQIEINKILREMKDEGVQAVAMEVSSHALKQNRVYGLKFKTVAFTNLTHDHLDYHITMEDYFLSKAKLFHDYEYNSAVINIDDPWGRRLWDEIHHNDKISYGFSPEAMVRPRAFYSGINGIITRCITPKGEIDIKSRLIGRHNLLNILTAIAISISLDIDLSDIKQGIENLGFVPGRLEPIPNNKGIHAFVDYAHTPDALKNILSVLRESVSGKIIVIFGCGGNRDKEKRPKMAEIAQSYADHIIITSDNPRDEDPNQIIYDILKGAEGISGYNLVNLDKFFVIPDRRKAIKTGLLLASDGDCIVVAGKGHEDYQIFKTKRERFSDREELEAALKMENSKEYLSEISSGYKLAGKIGDILGKIHGELISGEINDVFVGISTDSRTIEPANLFVALIGERFDAHNFLEDVIKKGASTIVVNKDKRDFFNKFIGKNVTIIGVEDTLQALGDLARWHKERLGLKTIAITGSCGKTSAKEFIAGVLAKRFPLIKTKGNFNNLIGLPLTLFEATPFHKWAVLEMGMNQKGEIKRLCEIAKPDIALITTIKPAHVGNLGGIKGILDEKKAVWEALFEGDIAIVNMDDPLLMEASREFSCHKYGYSFNNNHPKDYGISQLVWCKDVIISDDATTTATIKIDGEEMSLKLNTLGKASVQNALPAIVIAKLLGMTNDEIKDALEAVTPTVGRLYVHKLKDNFMLLDDSYNANPASMIEALNNLIAIRKDTKKIAIIGDMLELGDDTYIYHKEIGNSFSGVGIDEVIYVGEYFPYFSEGFRIKKENLKHFEKVQDLLSWLINIDLKDYFSNSTLLVKASNSVGLKKVVEFIVSRF